MDLSSQQENPMSGLIRKSDVRAKLNVGNTKLHEMIRAGAFPRPFKLPSLNGKLGRTSYWSAAVVDAWIAERVRAAVTNALATRSNDPFGRGTHGATCPEETHHA
jgi:predicted DNA-binding transcriptional regulator AlpA